MYGQQPPSYPPAPPALPPMQPESSGPRDYNAFLALAVEDSQGTQSYSSAAFLLGTYAGAGAKENWAEGRKRIYCTNNTCSARTVHW